MLFPYEISGLLGLVTGMTLGFEGEGVFVLWGFFCLLFGVFGCGGLVFLLVFGWGFFCFVVFFL